MDIQDNIQKNSLVDVGLKMVDIQDNIQTTTPTPKKFQLAKWLGLLNWLITGN